MSQRIEFESLVLADKSEIIKSEADKSNRFPRITAFFDVADYILERTVKLLKRIVQLTVEFIVESKILILVLVGLVILIIDLYRFIQFLLGSHPGINVLP